MHFHERLVHLIRDRFQLYSKNYVFMHTRQEDIIYTDNGITILS